MVSAQFPSNGRQSWQHGTDGENRQNHQFRIGMDSKGRVVDDILVELLWRSVKQEEIYTKEYDSVKELRESLQRYLDFDNRYPPVSLSRRRSPERPARGGTGLCDR